MLTLTEEQVVKFLEEKLKFRDWKESLERNRTEFLFQLVTKYGTTLCYENISWGSLEPEEWKAPTEEDAVNQILGTLGGACVHLNYFLKLVLETLGFVVHVISGEAKAMRIPNNHFGLAVESTKAGRKNELEGNEEGAEVDVYLVDVGFGRPITSPVNLRKTVLPYIGKAGGFKFEVRFNPEKNIYERVLFGGCAIKGKFEPEEEMRVEVIFSLTPRTFHDFDEPNSIIFTDPSRSFFLNTLFLFRFISIESDAEFKYVCCRGRSICFGTADDREETGFETYTEMLPDIEKWFPQLDAHKIKQALKNYDERSLSRKT